MKSAVSKSPVGSSAPPGSCGLGLVLVARLRHYPLDAFMEVCSLHVVGEERRVLLEVHHLQDNKRNANSQNFNLLHYIPSAADISYPQRGSIIPTHDLTSA